MIVARQLSLIITITIWATIMGGAMYSHVVYFPAYLSHLPESNQLITGEFGLHDSNFWMYIHPIAIVSFATTLVLNWKLEIKRKFILTTAITYVVILITTATYFVPELMAFADSTNDTSVTAANLFERGQTWQHLSWIRGIVIYCCFILLLIALTKNPKNEHVQ